MGIETIGRGVRALLGFLDMTSQGIGPDKLAGDVSLSVDGLAFIGESSCRVSEMIGATAGGGGDDAIVMSVPAGRIWIVREIGGYIEFSAADVAAGVNGTKVNLSITGFAQPEFRDEPVTNPFPRMFFFDNGAADSRQTTSVTAGATLPARLGVNHSFDAPLICRAGTQFVLETSMNSATNQPADLRLWLLLHDVPA